MTIARVEKYLGDGLRRQRLESHHLRPRTDRRQLLAGTGADEDHQRPRRRLFERLEQAVCALLAEVVGVVDDRHLAAAEKGPQRDAVAETVLIAVLFVADE